MKKLNEESKAQRDKKENELLLKIFCKTLKSLISNEGLVSVVPHPPTV